MLSIGGDDGRLEARSILCQFLECLEWKNWLAGGGRRRIVTAILAQDQHRHQDRGETLEDDPWEA